MGYNLHLNDDGHQNKTQWNFTPGMEANDSMFFKRGRRMQLPGQKTSLMSVITGVSKTKWMIFSIDGSLMPWKVS